MTKLHGDYSTEHGKTEAQIWTAVLILVIGIFIGVAMCCIQALAISAQAEETECWVLCRPDDYINIRETPSRKGIISGWAVSGMKFTTDLQEKGGYIHVLDVTENGDGWISSGYVVFSEPRQADREMVITGKGRVACRKAIGGKRRAWAKPGSRVTVYWMTGDWAVTNRGFIRSEYLGE